MLQEQDIVKLIFGLKVQQLRQEAGLNYQQLSDRTGLALSYLHNIEKGRKYPKADKILLLAQALDTDYNYLVSLEPNKKLKPIIDLLQSDFLKIFPLETFGIDTVKLLELLAQAPDKVNAFISTVLKITRNYNMQGEDFYKAALRSYQDLHDNYFHNLEQAVRDFRQTQGLLDTPAPTSEQLEQCLRERFGIRTDRELLPGQPSLRVLRSVYEPKRKVLCLNDGLNSAQERFLLAKEIGFQLLQPRERPFETRMMEVTSFEELLSNFHASYFSVALLLNEQDLTSEIRAMTGWTHWQGDTFLALLERYDVTAEMLVQRLANLLPHHFGLRQLFFLRFYTGPEMQKFIMTKEMHLSQLHDPHANQLDEHYCRRWISINLIRRLRAQQLMDNQDRPIIGAQISRYWDTPNAYFCITFAKPTRENPDNSSSVTIGLLVNEPLRDLFPFLADPAIQSLDVHTTCERCPIPDCDARVVPPVFLQRQRRRDAVRRDLANLFGNG
jgi:transcriptional regulator with XRE-family HTH domain